MIDKLKKIIETQTTILQKKAGIFKEEEIECAIDEEVVECDEMDSPYVGVPAPVVSPHDDWFDDPPKSEMQMEYEHINDDPHDGWWLRPEYQDTKESPNIHQEMYELATKAGKTTVQLNPVGGSETFQEGPGGWMSGTGYQGQGLTDR